MKPIITVCTGNICRSPMAAGLLRAALDKAGLTSQEVLSAGVAAYNGQSASHAAVEAMKEFGIDLGGHKSRELTRELLESAGLVLVMTQTHRDVIAQDFGPVAAPIFLWRENLPGNKQVPDPFGCSLEVYRDCRDHIAEAVEGWVAWVKKQEPHSSL